MTTATPISPEDLVAAALNSFTQKYKGATEAAAPEPEIPAVEPKKVVLTAGQVLFSVLFGKVPKNGDFGVTVLQENNVLEQINTFIPGIDPDYVPQIEELAVFADAVEHEEKVMLTGPTGAGKSSMVKYFCAKTGRPFIRVNMKNDMESSVLFGMLTAHGGATHWNDGPVTEAVRYGAMLLIDEWELMPSEIGMGMQNLLEEGGYLYLAEAPGNSKDRTIQPHKDFRIVYAGNTVGQGDDTGRHVGVSVQNTATIDRFTTTIYLGYLDDKHEVAIIKGKTGIDEAIAKKMVQLAKLVRNGANSDAINLTMSPRTLISWAQKWVRWDDGRRAFNRAFYDKLRSNDKMAVDQLYQKTFGA